jgi:hypothetical protein
VESNRISLVKSRRVSRRSALDLARSCALDKTREEEQNEKRIKEVVHGVGDICFLSLLFSGATFAQSVSIDEATPPSGTTPLEVSFSASHLGFDPEPCDYYWDFGDGDEDYSLSTSHTFNSEGDYTVTFYATDWETCSITYSASTVIHVDAPEAPTVSIQADPLNGVAPLLVNFTAQYEGYADVCNEYIIGTWTVLRAMKSGLTNQPFRTPSFCREVIPFRYGPDV